MNSFTVFATGNLAVAPESGTKGDRSYTWFRLIGNDYGGKDQTGNPIEVATSVWFIAFGRTGDAIAQNCQVGDQLIVTARIRQNNWTDKHDQKRYDHSYQVEGFKFGRLGRISRGEQGRHLRSGSESNPPPATSMMTFRSETDLMSGAHLPGGRRMRCGVCQSRYNGGFPMGYEVAAGASKADVISALLERQKPIAAELVDDVLRAVVDTEIDGNQIICHALAQFQEGWGVKEILNLADRSSCLVPYDSWARRAAGRAHGANPSAHSIAASTRSKCAPG